jgi:GH35 family endo-1,4-beta-xylanase
VSPENLLKFQSVHPAADRYVFEAQDRYVQFGLDRKMQVVGHNLVWHNQTSPWVFQGTDDKPADRETLLARMRDHIHTVVGRYKGKIHGWDVVNEAIDEDGSLRKAPWHDGIGDDYVAKAFEFAHEADPDGELYYNDYNLEKRAKRAGVIRRDVRNRNRLGHQMVLTDKNLWCRQDSRISTEDGQPVIPGGGTQEKSCFHHTFRKIRRRYSIHTGTKHTAVKLTE